MVYNQAPTAPSSISVPSEVIGGENLVISWGQSTDPDGNLAGYKLERKNNGGTWTQVYSGSSRSYTDSITYGWESVQYRVKAYDTAGAESAYATSPSRTVTNNRPPVISGSDTDLGSFAAAPPSYEYTVTDADGHQVTVVEKLDGTQLKSYTATPVSYTHLVAEAHAGELKVGRPEACAAEVEGGVLAHQRRPRLILAADIAAQDQGPQAPEHEFRLRSRRRRGPVSYTHLNLRH